MARSLALYLQVVVTNKTVMRMTVELQKAVYAHLLKADFARLARDTPRFTESSRRGGSR